MNIKNQDINYENQNFDDMEVNPYEIVIALSKKAREINDKTHKYLGPESGIKPINMALKKINNDKVKFVYNTEEKSSSSEEPSTDKE